MAFANLPLAQWARRRARGPSQCGAAARSRPPRANRSPAPARSCVASPRALGPAAPKHAFDRAKQPCQRSAGPRASQHGGASALAALASPWAHTHTHTHRRNTAPSRVLQAGSEARNACDSEGKHTKGAALHTLSQHNGPKLLDVGPRALGGTGNGIQWTHNKNPLEKRHDPPVEYVHNFPESVPPH